MSDLLFKCSVCSKHLAVNVTMLGRRFVCPECRTKIHAPTPTIVFRCPHCSLELTAPENLAMQDFECPHCEKKLVIPELSVVTCPSCEVNIELENDYYRELAGHALDCPECGRPIPVPPLPSNKPVMSQGDDAVLPKGFGHKTMKLDGIVSGVPQAERLNIGICPYCASKVHALHAGSYVCKSCGRIMRIANAPPHSKEP